MRAASNTTHGFANLADPPSLSTQYKKPILADNLPKKNVQATAKPSSKKLARNLLNPTKKEMSISQATRNRWKDQANLARRTSLVDMEARARRFEGNASISMAAVPGNHLLIAGTRYEAPTFVQVWMGPQPIII